MSTPTPPSGRVIGYFMRLGKRAHGLELKRVSSTIVFMFFGAVAIFLKNAFLVGLGYTEAAIVTALTLLLKGGLGYYYPLIRDPVLERFPEGPKRLAAESVAYAILQATSFAVILAFLMVVGVDVPGGFLRAVVISFGTSLTMGKLVGVIIDQLTKLLTHARERVSTLFA